jgi:uncharacterized membrane-anchored protein
MNRGLRIAVVASLALPVLALAALIFQQEYRVYKAPLLNVPVRGVDPRDLLQGHYIIATFDWDWQPEPDASGTGGLCVLASGEGTKPRVRFIDGWNPGNGTGADCRMVLAGKARAKRDGLTAAFVPANLDAGYYTLNLFVPESRARELEALIRERPNALTVDLAVLPDGSASVRNLRLDGKILGE